MSKFIVKLICCGREDGIYKADTWQEADDFRNSYTSGPGVINPAEPGVLGHERQGIIESLK